MTVRVVSLLLALCAGLVGACSASGPRAQADAELVNTYWRIVRLMGERLTFSRPASTLIAFPPSLARSERQLGEVLAEARRWQIRGGILSLRSEEGDELAVLEAVYLR